MASASWVKEGGGTQIWWNLGFWDIYIFVQLRACTFRKRKKKLKKITNWQPSIYFSSKLGIFWSFLTPRNWPNFFFVIFGKKYKIYPLFWYKVYSNRIKNEKTMFFFVFFFIVSFHWNLLIIPLWLKR